MPLRCSCGAVLPEDARFCHKCGAPQFAEDIARLNAPVEEQPRTALPVPPLVEQMHPPSRIGFTNGRAVRITLAVAALSLLAIGLIASIAPPMLIPIVIAAGFVSVRIYLGRTAEKLKPSSAAVLGAMPWLWLYLLEAFSTGFVVLTPSGREVVKVLKNPELAQLVDDPAKLIPWLIVVLFIGTISGALGGILAARFQHRNGPSH